TCFAFALRTRASSVWAFSSIQDIARYFAQRRRAGKAADHLPIKASSGHPLRMRTILRLFIAVTGFASGVAFYAACGGDDDTGTTAPADSGLSDAGPRGFEQAGQA